jgi:glycosyltransferase involved in cell wall biosynthesis
MKILQIGPISNVGGVSIHIHRLTKLLKTNFNTYNFTFIDESPLSCSPADQINLRRVNNFLKCIEEIKHSDLIHIHSGHWLIRIFNILIVSFLRRPFVVTLHSFRISGFKNKITFFFLKKAKKIIVVSDELEQILNMNNIECYLKEAFIPPFLEDEKRLPTEIEERINRESKNKVLICANAFRLTPFNGKELYGLDQCIEVAAKSKTENLNILIIFVIGNIRELDELYLSMNGKVQQLNLEKYIWIIPYNISFVNLIKQCQIVIRPTLSDGDALTIREGLYLNKKVIASDIVKRPTGTIVYKTGQSIELYYRIIDCINNDLQFVNGNTLEQTLQYSNFYNQLYTK